MLGAITGDIIGSIYEFNNHKSKDFPLFDEGCKFTDDTVMTVAIADSLLTANGDLSLLGQITIKKMREYGKAYPGRGYGVRFNVWLQIIDSQPYNSFGNGAAMRISPVGWIGNSLEEVKKLSSIVTSVTHNHPEGIKGAEAVAVAIYLARTKHSQEEIRTYINKHYYDLNFTLDEIRPRNKHDETCQKSVPQAIVSFLEAKDFENSIRNAISIGGDSDTIGAIAGSIAEAYFGIPTEIKDKALAYLDDDLISVVNDFQNHVKQK